MKVTIADLNRVTISRTSVMFLLLISSSQTNAMIDRQMAVNLTNATLLIGLDSHLEPYISGSEMTLGSESWILRQNTNRADRCQLASCNLYIERESEN